MNDLSILAVICRGAVMRSFLLTLTLWTSVRNLNLPFRYASVNVCIILWCIHAAFFILSQPISFNLCELGGRLLMPKINLRHTFCTCYILLQSRTSKQEPDTVSQKWNLLKTKTLKATPSIHNQVTYDCNK